MAQPPDIGDPGRSPPERRALAKMLGVLFFLALAVIGATLLLASDFAILRSWREWHVTFPHLSGLKEGDGVFLLGNRMGTVHRITFEPDRNRFRVVLRMAPDAPLREGYRIWVADRSMLGGRLLAVYPGAVGAPPVDVTDLRADPRPRTLIAAIHGVRDEVTKVLHALNDGQGTIGRLLKDDTVYRDLRESAAALRTATDKLEQGDGALARLLEEDSGKLVTDLHTAVRSLKDLAEKVQAGEGTMGALFQDKALYEDLKKAVANLKRATDDVNRFIERLKHPFGKRED
jgi:phospholipid/cholesterol/gamma-HCH transport system substrate-binding protein